MPTTRVSIARILEYESTLLDSATALLLEDAGLRPAFGDRILVKPNLVASSNARHSCTNPLVVKSACKYLLDHNADVTVADSPAFGPASHVARASGLKKALAPLGLNVTSLRHPTPIKTSQGNTIGISQDALRADRVLNIPKLKVHCQMTISGAVKNLFGCVVGFRKALAHNQLGHSHDIFRSMLMDVYEALPSTTHLMDGIHPLHKDGPIKGEPYELGLLAASDNGIALDTTAYEILGLTPDQIPLWAEALQRNMDGGNPPCIEYPFEKPTLFTAQGFELSPTRDLEFNPKRIITGRVRSLLKHFTKT